MGKDNLIVFAETRFDSQQEQKFREGVKEVTRESKPLFSTTLGRHPSLVIFFLGCRSMLRIESRRPSFGEFSG